MDELPDNYDSQNEENFHKYGNWVTFNLFQESHSNGRLATSWESAALRKRFPMASCCREMRLKKHFTKIQILLRHHEKGGCGDHF
jgi:hypothetical protein